MKPIRVLLVDDHALVRAGFCSLFESITGVEIVAEAKDGREALHMIEEKSPDIVLMDIAMPELNGLDATARISRDFPNVRVIILSMHATEEFASQALQIGAAGYLIKDASPNELELAVRSVAKGETYLSPVVSKHVIKDYLRRTSGTYRPDDETGPYRILTPRQREVLQLIAEGHTSPEIAQTLNISLKTVETHRRHIAERLNIHDIAGLVRYAVRIGLVTTE